jgi:antitoxin component YwqK of YwqJK toxin-antitoxin module
MELFADNPVLVFDPIIPGGNSIGCFESQQPFFSTMNTIFSSNHFAVTALACAALLTSGCSEKNAPQGLRMTNGVPLALDDELQNRKDGKWYWRDTTNLFNGIEVLHHTNGVIKLQLPFTNGLPHGHRMMWHPNGQNESQGDYVDGQRSGLWETWFANGKPDKKGMFVNGKATGLQTFWHTNGVKSIEWFYKDGYPHGEMTRYHENGVKQQHGFYETNRQHGKWIAWDENGGQIREAEFDKGKLISEKILEGPPKNNEAKPTPQGSDG